MQRKDRRVDGRLVTSVRVYQEGDYWRWFIETEDYVYYSDGGNYRTEEDAQQGLRTAYDPLRVTENPQAVIGIPVAQVSEYEWLDCWPVVENDTVVGVIGGDEQTLAGPYSYTELTFDDVADCYRP